ncbi:GNAT family N-acetyltransferase [Halalkalibacterium halodurans]|uniref:Lipid II:glycine glycyltransferase n=1 Tax=Halalkalibacterium halodurans TaxID=86665 RepID=A0A0M0KFR5_ALKHA|nr:GNAT family N-acetyltransferase [Halalkalibacterium halodurans]TPE68981.1 peptidoglycan bridge formation glycyltransferase FemA/FemB family protein [Halalkalibacterium halodurans]
MIDIYFEPNYGKLYEKIENGTCEVFNYKCDLGNIHHVFIKRQIPFQVDDNIYFDIVTPYGYGGPLITNHQEERKDQLLREFKREFNDYCKKNNIISEFVRFHPMIDNFKDFKDVYEISLNRKTVGTNLSYFDDPFRSEFSKSCRKNIRKALKEGVTYRVTEKPDDISAFKKIYYSTMDRNNATDYYYFDDNYFDNCTHFFKENLLLVEAIYEDQPIAMGLYFIYKNVIHIHLSGTLTKYLYLSPAYILRYAVTLWGKENGYEMIHHGGGRTNDINDTLYKFKKQFGKNTEFDFYIGKKIWDLNIYNRICAENSIDSDIDYFPAYRSDL